MSCWFLCDPCGDAKSAMANGNTLIGAAGGSYIDVNFNSTFDAGIDVRLYPVNPSIYVADYNGEPFLWGDVNDDGDVDRFELVAGSENEICVK